jgi:hypothetical protein
MSYPQITYNTEPVKLGHWALEKLDVKNPNYIAKFTFFGKEVTVKLNPSDARGYRLIVVRTDSNMQSTLNQEHHLAEERILIHLVASLLEMVGNHLGLISQSEMAGNNSHTSEFDLESQTQVLKVGFTEPSMLHMHLIFRGDTEHEYIEGQKLKGPALGQMFNMRGDAQPPSDYVKGQPLPVSVQGNTRKEEWKHKKKAVQVFTGLIDKVFKEEGCYHSIGLRLVNRA